MKRSINKVVMLLHIFLLYVYTREKQEKAALNLIKNYGRKHTKEERKSKNKMYYSLQT